MTEKSSDYYRRDFRRWLWLQGDPSESKAPLLYKSGRPGATVSKTEQKYHPYVPSVIAGADSSMPACIINSPMDFSSSSILEPMSSTAEENQKISISDHE